MMGLQTNPAQILGEKEISHFPRTSPKEDAAAASDLLRVKPTDPMSGVRIFHVVLLCGLCGRTVLKLLDHIPVYFCFD